MGESLSLFVDKQPEHLIQSTRLCLWKRMEDDHISEVASPLAPLEQCTLLISELVHTLPWFSLVQCHVACTI